MKNRKIKGLICLFVLVAFSRLKIQNSGDNLATTLISSITKNEAPQENKSPNTKVKTKVAGAFIQKIGNRKTALVLD